MSHNVEYVNNGPSRQFASSRTNLNFGLVKHPLGDASDYPRIFALFCDSLGVIDYCDESYARVSRAYKSLPSDVRQHYSILRYDVHTSSKRKVK